MAKKDEINRLVKMNELLPLGCLTHCLLPHDMNIGQTIDLGDSLVRIVRIG